MRENFVMRALDYASTQHKEQRRKYTDEPYILHPIAVAKKVQELGDIALAAAILHDVIEDTDSTYDDIFKLFGKHVADVVQELTDPTLEEGNRAKRKEITREKMAGGSFIAKSIKCADILHNAISILEYDKDFAVVFMREIELLFPCLKGADEDLLKEVEDLIENNKGKTNE